MFKEEIIGLYNTKSKVVTQHIKRNNFSFYQYINETYQGKTFAEETK